MVPEGSVVVVVGIGGLALLSAGLFVWAVAHAWRGQSPLRAGLGAATGAAGWLGLTWGLAARGTFADLDARPPPQLFMMAAIFALGLGLGVSKVGAQVAARVPMGALVLAQGFRLPLELVMHQAALEGVMPVELSYSGYNFDVVTGASALLVGGLALAGKAPRWLVWAWLALAFGTLGAIAFIALATSPLVHLFGTEPAHLNLWATQPPYVWLPAGPVVFALAGQVTLLRQLLADRRRATA